MGDRALIVFTNTARDEVSPVVYLHWDGHNVPEWLAELKAKMAGREGDVPYSAARFVGICHEHIDGNVSLGMWNAPTGMLANPAEHSHGDAGVIVVNANDYSWQAFGGYLEKQAA